jgi:hypothetical protein
VAFRSFGQDTESGLFPAASVIFELIWLWTSALLTVLGPLEIEHPAMPPITDVAAQQTSNIRIIELAMPRAFLPSTTIVG